MIGKSARADFPDLRTRAQADKPLKQLKIDSFSSSVVSIEGHFTQLVLWIDTLDTDGCME